MHWVFKEKIEFWEQKYQFFSLREFFLGIFSKEKPALGWVLGQNLAEFFSWTNLFEFFHGWVFFESVQKKPELVAALMNQSKKNWVKDVNHQRWIVVVIPVFLVAQGEPLSLRHWSHIQDGRPPASGGGRGTTSLPRRQRTYRRNPWKVAQSRQKSFRCKFFLQITYVCLSPFAPLQYNAPLRN